MKKLKWGLVALSLAIIATSCNNETVESANDKKLSFQPALGKQTKATEFLYWTTGQSIPVKGYQTGSTSTTAIFDATLTYAGPLTTNWTYTPAVDQPGYSLTYYSWYPMTNVAALATADGTTATFPYAVLATAATQEDLIATSVSTATAVVPLAFDHLLSQVNFAIQGFANIKVRISLLSVASVKTTSTYTFVPNSAGSWATPTVAAAVPYAYTPVAGTNVTDGVSTAVYYMGNGGGANTNDNALMLMPQTFAVPADGTFSFHFELFALDAVIGTDAPIAEGNITANLCDFTTTTWAMGKRYIYLIDMSDYLSTGQISFAVTVNQWADTSTPAYIAQTLQAASTAVSIEAAIANHAEDKGVTSTLTVFPIALLPDPTATTTITNIATGFAVGDQIRIECPTAAGAAFVLKDAALTDWTYSILDAVVTLTKTS